MAEWDDNTKAQVKKIPLLTENAGPRDPKEKWDARLKQVGREDARQGREHGPRAYAAARSRRPRCSRSAARDAAALPHASLHTGTHLAVCWRPD